MSKLSYPAASKDLKITIPDDILYEILLHLPVESLLRFKSVCKTWLALISSPSFVESHLATSSPDDELHIAHSHSYRDHHDTFVLLLSRNFFDFLDFPFSIDEFPYTPNCKIFGSACGIVSVLCTFKDIYKPHMYLWNPATGLSKRICSPDFETKNYALGFGFDSIGDDFKVVAVQSYSAAVYSANRNAWRSIDTDLTDFPVNGVFDVCVNGFLCAAGSHGMIAFDLNSEVFNCGIKFPAPTYDIIEFDCFEHQATITNYNDSIAAIIFTSCGNDCNINLWSLDDEACLRGGGICSSWTLRLNIIVKQPVQFVYGYLRDGDFLLVNNDKVWYLNNSDDNEEADYLYNSENDEEADLCIPQNEKARNFSNAISYGQIFRYTKSLFKIDGFTQVNWNAREDDNEGDNEDNIEDDNGDDNEKQGTISGHR